MVKEYLPLPMIKAGTISYETPLDGSEFLVNNPYPKNLFNAASFGSYLIWIFNGEEKVFIDPRIELYPSEQWNDYLLISMGMEGWDEKLAQYEINTLMLSRLEQLL
jgi:hypothetical protein